MSKKMRRLLKIIVIICILVLIFDIGVLIYNNYITEEKDAYFDGINSFETFDDMIIAVGSNSNNDKGYEKAKITLYDKEYQKVWETLYNKKYNSSFSAVKRDNEEDNFIAVGSLEANSKEHSDKTRSAVIAKFDKDGKLLSDKRFQVLGNSKFTNILIVDDGYIVVGQSIYENMTLGVSDEGGAFIIKYDKELKEVWKKNYGGSKSGLYNDSIIYDNYIYAVGKDYARVGIISKYSLDGEYISTSTYDFTDTLGFTGITTDNNYLYVVGAKKISEDKNDYDTDALIIKYDFNLNEIENKIYTGKGIERFNKVIVDTNSNIVISGQTGIYNEEKSTSNLNVFSYDGIIAKYSSDLKELLIEQYGDVEDDYFTDIVEKDNLYFVSGYSSDDGSYLSKFITYTKSGKIKGVIS